MQRKAIFITAGYFIVFCPCIIITCYRQAAVLRILHQRSETVDQILPDHHSVNGAIDAVKLFSLHLPVFAEFLQLCLGVTALLSLAVYA